MSHEFNIDTVLEIAEMIEKNGAEFYQNNAHRMRDPLCKTLLLDLAQMEREHQALYASLRVRVRDDQSLVAAFGPHDQRYWYLKALADARVFFDLKGDPKTMTEILKRGITAEKESIIFYLGIKDLMVSEQGKEDVNKIIREEMSHLILLSKQLITLKDYE